MGGLGSGNSYLRSAKHQVEGSLSLAIGQLRCQHRWHERGTINWTFENGNQSEAGFLMSFVFDPPVLMLRYCLQDGKQITVPVGLQKTSGRFGREAWWFTCPLENNGVPCNRRVGKLYLPPNAIYFGCRTCHGLAYRSSQEAHRLQRLRSVIDRFERSGAAEEQTAAKRQRKRREAPEPQPGSAGNESPRCNTAPNSNRHRNECRSDHTVPRPAPEDVYDRVNDQRWIDPQYWPLHLTESEISAIAEVSGELMYQALLSHCRDLECEDHMVSIRAVQKCIVMNGQNLAEWHHADLAALRARATLSAQNNKAAIAHVYPTVNSMQLTQ